MSAKMTRRREFDYAVEAIQKALRDRAVTRGLTSTASPKEEDIVTEIIIRAQDKPRSTYYYENSEGYNDLMGIQSNFELGILEDRERLDRDLKQLESRRDRILSEHTSSLVKAEKLDKELKLVVQEIAQLKGQL